MKEEGEAYNLIIRRTGVVGPSGLLHNPLGHSLKVKQVVALLEQGHLLNALQALLLLGVDLGLLGHDGGHVDGAQVLVLGQVLLESVWGVDGIELLSSVLAGILEDNLHAAGVLGEELCDIVGLAVDNDPAVILGVVLGDLDAGQWCLGGHFDLCCVVVSVDWWFSSCGSGYSVYNARFSAYKPEESGKMGVVVMVVV